MFTSGLHDLDPFKMRAGFSSQDADSLSRFSPTDFGRLTIICGLRQSNHLPHLSPYQWLTFCASLHFRGSEWVYPALTEYLDNLSFDVRRFKETFIGSVEFGPISHFLAYPRIRTLLRSSSIFPDLGHSACQPMRLKQLAIGDTFSFQI